MTAENVKRVVGLKYDPEDGPPTVVLRGAGATAEAVLANGAARKRHLPVVRNEYVLEQLFRMPLDAPIDPSLYELVAILLVHVFAVDEVASPHAVNEKGY